MTKKKTRKEDAESIVGKNQAEEIDALAKVSTQRSDVLIEMSETEAETIELINEIEEKAKVDSEDTQDDAADESDGETEEGDNKNAKKSKSEVVEKFEDATMDKVVNEPPDYVANLPFGGATSMKDAENYVAAKNEAIYLMDMWSVFCSVMYNIMDRPDVTDKRSAMNAAVDEFKNVLTAKAMVAFAMTEKSTAVESHELQPALDALLSTIDNSLKLESDVNERLTTINPALQELGGHISEYVTSKSQVIESPVPQKPDEEKLLTEIKSLVQPLSEALGILREEVSTLKSQVKAGDVPVKNRIPAPRTMTAGVYKAQEQEQPKPGSLTSIIRKSVGL